MNFCIAHAGSEAVPSALLSPYTHGTSAHAHYNIHRSATAAAGSGAGTWWAHVKAERANSEEVAMVNTLFAAAEAQGELACVCAFL